MASHSDNRAALFGGARGQGGEGAGGAAAHPAARRTPPPAAAAPATGSNGGGSAGAGAAAAAAGARGGARAGRGGGGGSMISERAREAKVAEAEEERAAGNKYMATSMFKWKPEPFAAAPHFQKAGHAYRTAGQHEYAKLMFSQAADCHLQAGSPAPAGTAFKLAAEAAAAEGADEEAAQFYSRSAEVWMDRGDVNQAAAYLVKAGECVEDADPDRAQSLFLQAMDLLVEEQESAGEDLSRISVSLFEPMRKVVQFFVRRRRFAIGIGVTQRFIRLCYAQGSTVSMCKAMVALTLMQLGQGDVVAAHHTYLNDHLNNSDYLRSSEAKIAEDFIMAFKNRDPEALVAAQENHMLMHLERAVMELAKDLSIVGDEFGDGDDLDDLPALPGQQQASSTAASSASATAVSAAAPQTAETRAAGAATSRGGSNPFDGDENEDDKVGPNANAVPPEPPITTNDGAEELKNPQDEASDDLLAGLSLGNATTATGATGEDADELDLDSMIAAARSEAATAASGEPAPATTAAPEEESDEDEIDLT